MSTSAPGTLNAFPTPRPMLDFIETPFAWVAFCFTWLSIAVSMYIFIVKLRFPWVKFCTDLHFRLRWILSFFLLFNRSCNVLYLFLSYRLAAIDEAVAKGTSTLQLSKEMVKNHYSKERNQLILHQCLVTIFSWSTLYTMLGLTLFLTLDRYRRVHMILPGTWLYRFFALVVFVVSTMIVLITFSYCLLIFYLDLGSPYDKNPMPEFSHWVEVHRRYLEIGFVGAGVIIYYTFSLLLISSSIRSTEPTLVEQDATKEPSRGTFSIHFRDRIPKSDSQMELMAEDKIEINASGSAFQGRKRLELVKMRKLWAAVKMISLFLVIVMIDLAMFSMSALVGLNVITMPVSESYHFAAFVASWIVFHVLCVFELLDMFVKDLRKAAECSLELAPHSSREKMQQQRSRKQKSPLEKSTKSSAEGEVFDMDLFSFAETYDSPLSYSMTTSLGTL